MGGPAPSIIARSSSHDAEEALRDLVLATPGLDRMVGGVLIDAAALHSAAGRPGALSALVAGRRAPLGVRMGDETVRRLDVDGATDDLAGEIAQHAPAGASFARWRPVDGEGPGPRR